MAFLQAAKILRAFRLVRLVRVIARSPSMLNVAQSISLSLKEMSNVLLILVLVITIFAILGVQLFAGKLHFCNDSSVPDKASCTGTLHFSGQVRPGSEFRPSCPQGYHVQGAAGTYIDAAGVQMTRKWLNTKYNFDNLGQALMSLLITLTLDGYLEIMMPCLLYTSPSPRD